MSDRRFQELYTKFTSDPEDVGAIIKFINLSKRLGRELPSGFYEIKEFCKNNQTLIKSYIKAMVHTEINEPAIQAYLFVGYYNFDTKWAESIIENAKTGDPSRAAYNMVEYYSSKEWAESVIENAKTGDPSSSAYSMARDYGSNKKWAESIIENSKIGNPSWAAYMMVLYLNSDRKWAESVIDNAKTGDPYEAAARMVLYCGSDVFWANKVAKNAERLGLPNE